MSGDGRPGGALPDDADLIIDDPAEASPRWVTTVLRRADLDIEVTAVRSEPIGTGQLSANYRIHLDLDGADAARAPATLVLKLPAGSDQARAQIAAGYRSEIGFYTRFAASTTINVPRCWGAAISADARAFTLVLADAHPARAGRQVDGCAPAQADTAVRNLAALHAPFWGLADLGDGVDWLRRTDEVGLGFMAEVLAASTAPFVERYAGRLPAEDADTLRRVAEVSDRWGRHVSGRHSLIHGDYRLDNLLFEGSSAVIAVDWQSLEIGFPGRDLAYFLSTALAPARRRAHERDLIRAYHQRLTELGVTGYPLEDCFHDYRLGMLQGPLLTVLGALYATHERTESADRMFLSMAANSCAAIRELGTLELLAA
ncbi:Aminoglycoside phosphotransferase [Frankia sp. AiPs1]|uniref:ecdysteroid 22-kinase family protein n=1 Tax=Frankia sp. AiPa1 TaxID=573492 RepID=UPI00202B9446|nr:ecdysteroid 22-kinase family protein [Frankia sp. AiPa1]MCL9761677.1 ecdysteroid 22-kinase family protein [Frankia sp. AiPa1]